MKKTGGALRLFVQFLKFGCFTFGGGLNIDDQIRVLKEDGVTPIYGLYACGGDSLGVLMCDEKNYSGLGGPANGWAYFSGYMAGETCGNYVLELLGY